MDQYGGFSLSMQDVLASQVDWLVVQIVELGPFGSRINRGQTENIEDIPEGYKAVLIEPKLDCTIVYIERVK